MKNTLIKGLTVFGIMAGVAGTAAAGWAPLNDYDLNFSGAGATLGAVLPDLRHVDESQFLVWSTIGFNDNDGSGAISAGDTFTEYAAMRITGFTSLDGTDVTPAGYGAGAAGTHEITAIFQASGFQAAGGVYLFNALDRFDVYFDAGRAFTKSAFANLNTFSDGTKVETFTFNAPSGGVNFDPLAPNGTVDMFLSIHDLLKADPAGNGKPFEIAPSGETDPAQMVPDFMMRGIIDGNFNVLNNVPQAVFAGYFGYNPADYDFIYGIKTDGSFNKEIIPEPGTMVLLGSGLLGMAGIARRRKKA